ncbi:FAD-dependent oxidoreductase [Polaromonas sp. P1(28)-13]|nr:FAD-dependent oxidoreductase [Polaromonas sp. P1(28)-13]
MNKIMDTIDFESSHWDLVVIGAGLAGLSAALRASELGARVALLEQGHAATYPCNTRFSGGIIHVAHRNVRRPAGELLGFIQKANSEADPAISQALALHANRFLTWIQGQGGKFIRFGNNEALSWCMAPPRPLRAGLDWERRGPDTLMRLLSQRLAERGGQTFWGCALAHSPCRTAPAPVCRPPALMAGMRGGRAPWSSPTGAFKATRRCSGNTLGPDPTSWCSAGPAPARATA